MKTPTRPHLAGLIALTAALAVVPPPADAAARATCAGVRATIVGTAGADVIRGTTRKDVIAGLGGNDRIVGRGGADIICGGAGNDVVVTSTSGRARLYGDGGADSVTGNGPADHVDGGPGNDVVRTTARGVLLVGGTGNDRLTGGRYDDRLAGGDGDDVVRGGPGSDIVHGNDGADQVLSDTGRGDQLWGDAGDDRLVADAVHASVFGGIGDDLLTDRAGEGLLFGGEGDDQLNGADVPGVAEGGFGNDLILLGDGNDEDVHGGPGRDEIDGGGGQDVLDADDDADTCRGGSGTDTCHGGSPGGPENLPGDDDVCDAEVKISCRDVALPARWRVHLEGTSVHTVGDSYETTTVWSLTGDVIRSFAQDGKTWYLLTTGLTGTWTATGHNQYCTINGSGPIGDGDLSFVLALDEPGEAYRFEWGGLADTIGTATCPWGEDAHQIHTDTTDGVVAGWNPGEPLAVLAGHRDSPAGDAGDTARTDYTWTITPVE
ncbi:MAG TPA: calcium-binding protein [Nocardioides sp.]|nr:calcium-binding protein [Nocardioides sp.]